MLSLFGCVAIKSLNAQYDEKYRPQFHFSPQKGWIGDPDGLIYSEGTYHLFWWGHAISKDLVHWEELPYPMKGGDRSFSYFSGSVVVDKDNTAGFGEKSMIAIYTMHRRGDSLPETQALSVSNDRINFDFYKDNPVLDVRKVFFRDPQVFWHEPVKKWIMVVTVPDIHKIHFYSSRNLKDWIYLSEFGDLGPRSSFWECPDMFEMEIEGEPGKKKWVVLIGQGPNRVQYFIGSFDGKRFRADEETIAFLNEGKGLPGKVFESFDEANYGSWKISGDAFGIRPDRGDSIVRIGLGNASSHNGNDFKKGTLTSPAFTITEPVINFLIAGGNHPDTTCINLLVDNKVVRTATGTNSDLLKWNGWDVSELKGKKAVIKIVDNYSGSDKGYIRIDHILFSKTLQPKNLQHGLWLDHGTDFYATRSYRFPENPEHKPVFLGWLGNWDYANSVPSQWGRGFQSLPRDIALKKFPEGVRLVQSPITGLKQLRKDSVTFTNRTISGTADITEFKPNRNTYEIEAIFNTESRSVFGFNLLVGEGRKLMISYDPKTSSLCVDRTNCSDFTSNANFAKKFPAKAYASVEPENNQIKLHILIDESSVEIFTSQGKIVLSLLTYPSPSQTGVQLFSEKGTTKLVSFKGWQLNSIWKKSE
jgi:sucrose-6-phosphate hydrolase SacC (GH32 family)